MFKNPGAWAPFFLQLFTVPDQTCSDCLSRGLAVNKVTSRSGTETYLSTPWFPHQEPSSHMNLDHGLAASSWIGLSALVIFGLNTSRSQSPSRLITSTSTTRQRPGKAVIHQDPEKM